MPLRSPKAMGDHQIFREDFRNQMMVTENGGTITTGLNIDRGAEVVTTNTGKIVYSNTKNVFNNRTKFTVHAKLRTPTSDITSATYYCTTYDGTNYPIHVLIFLGKLRAYVGTAANGYCLSPTLTVDTDYNVVIVYDGSQAVANDRIKIYMGGVLTSNTYSGTIPAISSSGTSGINIFSTNGTASAQAGAKLYNFAVYDAAWTPEEVADAYRNSTYSEIDPERATFWLPLRNRFAEVQTTELLADGDMEAAGTSVWTAGNSAILTKDTTIPHSGTQCLRITYTSVLGPCAYRTMLTTGKKYRLIGWARGDGTVNPRVFTVSNFHWIGTTSTSWQYFNVTVIATGVLLYLGSAGAVGYVEFDDVSVVEVTEKTENKGSASKSITVGNGYTTTTFPTFFTPHGFSVDGGDYLQSGTVDLTGSPGLTMFAVCGGLGAGAQAIIDFGTTVLSSPGGLIYYSGTEYRFYAGSTAGGVGNAGLFPIDKRGLAVVVGVSDGTATDIYVNGVKGTTAATPASLEQSATQFITVGIRTDKSNTPMSSGGKVYSAGMFPIAMTPRQVQFLTQKLRRELNI